MHPLYRCLKVRALKFPLYFPRVFCWLKRYIANMYWTDYSIDVSFWLLVCSGLVLVRVEPIVSWYRKMKHVQQQQQIEKWKRVENKNRKEKKRKEKKEATTQHNTTQRKRGVCMSGLLKSRKMIFVCVVYVCLGLRGPARPEPPAFNHGGSFLINCPTSVHFSYEKKQGIHVMDLLWSTTYLLVLDYNTRGDKMKCWPLLLGVH